MDYFAQQLINGLVLGSIYGLIAIGYTMVYGIVGMINFAHGDVFMIGGFIALITFLLLISTGLTAIPVILLIVLLVSMAITALYGWTIERIAYRPLRHSFRLAPMLSAIGMSFVLTNYSQVAQGARVKPIPPVITGGYTLHESADGFVIQLSNIQIIVVITTIVLLAIFTWLVSRTRLGRDMRACEQDQTMAALLGVDVDRTISMTFVIGAALAAVAGLMYLLYYGLVDFFMGFVAGIKAFTAAVLGGIGSLPGAMLGGLAIGLIETFWSAYFSVEYKDVAAFSILIVVLIFMPTGLLGRPEVEKSDGRTRDSSLDQPGQTRNEHPRSPEDSLRQRADRAGAVLADDRHPHRGGLLRPAHLLDPLRRPRVHRRRRVRRLDRDRAAQAMDRPDRRREAGAAGGEERHVVHRSLPRPGAPDLHAAGAGDLL